MLVDLIEDCDQILVMSVNPGFGGQSFIERALVKLAQVRALIDERNPACELEVDGGIGRANIERAAAAGADAGRRIERPLCIMTDLTAALHDMRIAPTRSRG